MKRIFVAIGISEKAKTEVSSYVKTLRDDFKHLRVGWEKKEKLHLTLKFLGDIEKVDFKNLSDAVDETAGAFSAFSLKIAETGVFPNRKKARVLWLGLKDNNENLKKIHKRLESNCENYGLKKEKRNFNPHLTIARLRQPHQSKKLVESHLENKFEPVEFEVTEIVIIESKLKRTGSVYSVLAEYELVN